MDTEVSESVEDNEVDESVMEGRDSLEYMATYVGISASFVAVINAMAAGFVTAGLDKTDGGKDGQTVCLKR